MLCSGSDLRFPEACMHCHGRKWGSSSVRKKLISGVGHLTWLVGSWTFYRFWGSSNWSCHVDFTSLNVHGELNHIILTLRHMFIPVDLLAWVNVEGGCYRVVSENGSILVGWCLVSVLLAWICFNVYMLVAYVSLCLWYMNLLRMHGDGHGCRCDVMKNVDGIVVGMHPSWMHVNVYMYCLCMCVINMFLKKPYFH